MTSQKPFIVFITGVSTSGKTTLYESLQKDTDFKEVVFHDIDENGVPDVGRIDWRKFRVEELLYEAIGRQEAQGSSTVICGITFPHEVIESRYYKPEYNVHFIYLENSFEQFEERAMKRVEKHLQNGKFDESFNPDNTQEMLVVVKQQYRILHNSIVNQRNGHLLSVSNLDKQQMHSEAVRLIHEIASSK